MEQKKTRKWPRSLAIWAITFVLVVGCSCMGILLRRRVTAPHIGFWVSLCVLALLFVGSLLAYSVLSKRTKAADAKGIHAYREERRARMQENEKREARRLNHACALTVAYLAALGVSALALCFFSGAADIGVTVVSIFAMYIVYGLVSRLFREKEKTDHSLALQEKEYPRLYALARETAEFSADTPLYIFLGAPTPDSECNAGVGKVGKEIHLVLGATLLCIMTEGELRQILRHEFAHIEQEDTKEFTRYTKLMEYLMQDSDDSVFNVWTSFVVRFPAAYLLLEGQIYFALSSSGKETRADSSAADSGDVRSQADALAKLSAYKLFIHEQEPYTNVYRSEAVPEHMVTERIHLFRKALLEREGDWRRILENEIPARVASHPTFKQRWDALGNCPYSLAPAAMEGDFSAECWAAAAESDRRMHEIEPEKYAQLRQEHYLDHLKTVEDYEKENRLLQPEEMRPVIYGYYALGMPEKAEALCDRVIVNNDSLFATAFARYWKGILMLYRYDKNGLDYIYQAMEANRNYIESGLEKIGSYCTMMGLQEELEEYRSRALDFMQTDMDHSVGGIHAKAKLSKETLPGDWQEKILSYILQNAEGKVSQVYLVHEQASEAYAPSSFVLRFADDATEEECARIYDRVFRLLDDWPEDWEFCLYDYEPSMEKPLMAVEGACIYDAKKN